MIHRYINSGLNNVRIRWHLCGQNYFCGAWELKLRFQQKWQMVQMEVTLVSTSENDIIFKSKIILPLIELKCFKTIALNNDLILEAGIDSSDESDLKRKDRFSSIKINYFILRVSFNFILRFFYFIINENMCNWHTYMHI